MSLWSTQLTNRHPTDSCRAGQNKLKRGRESPLEFPRYFRNCPITALVTDRAFGVPVCKMATIVGRCSLRCRSLVSVAGPHHARLMSTGNNDKSPIVPVDEVSGFIQRCMVAVGTDPKHALALAENLTTADHRGHFSHGFNRLSRWWQLTLDLLN